MAESVIIEKSIRRILLDDPAVKAIVADRVYIDAADPADPNVMYPFIVINIQSQNDIRVVGIYRIFVEARVQVKAISQSSDKSTLAPLADAIEACLTFNVAKSPVFSGQMYDCYREEPVSMTTTEDSKTYAHLGGIYHVHAKQTF